MSSDPGFESGIHIRTPVRPSGGALSKNQTSVNEAPSSTIRRVSCGSCDGGESGAGERLERLLEMSGCENAVVVVYRWYGGVPLGSDRWKCISGVAKEALRAGDFTGEKMAQKPHVDNAKEKRARRKR
ncbi:hypothetical protein PHLCEN_2v11099 [Hermanssonia centrifuga]|uniref:Impact N-terminal domain-containing protein n=1 Tax=Hermanssonia centrifuga TaxID=98765 RepID=A0A2R6NKS7_9APHY|nr:hypothetical protein PHLCEN_2v11099 [Hermanssonia centrifuga]